MKKSFVAIVMSFVIVFSSISNSFAYNDNFDTPEPLVVDGGVISGPMLATVVSLGLGTGIAIKNNDMIYDVGRQFVEYVKRHNDLTMDFVNSAFLAGATVINNKVHVDSQFSDIVKGFFDTFFKDKNSDIVALWGGVPFGKTISYDFTGGSDIILHFDNLHVEFTNDRYSTAQMRQYDLLVRYGENLQYTQEATFNYYSGTIAKFHFTAQNPKSLYWNHDRTQGTDTTRTFSLTQGNGIVELPSVSIPYSGGYDWGLTDDKKENDSIVLPVPGNLGNLVGQTTDDFWANDSDLVGSNPITKPNVSNPSVDVTDDVFPGVSNPSVPGNPSIPGDDVFSSVKDFIISLVVPSDSFWTDTFNGFRDNLSKNFPMLDMSKFDSLLVNGKPFPNIYAFGSIVVNGDIINSIVDWLRPIVAGFVMLLLLFFNYRKLHKIIRNSEPYGSVAEKGCTSNVN